MLGNAGRFTWNKKEGHRMDDELLGQKQSFIQQ